MKYFKFLILLLAFSPVVSVAQNPELINSGEVIKKCAELFDSSKYREALPLLKKINRSDTNYVRALYERSIDLEADSQFSAAIKCCQEALALKTQREFEPELYNTYANSEQDLGHYDKALHIFDVAIAKYPSYSLLYFNKGIVYMAEKKPADAEVWFQKALLINPYMYSAHYQLGLAALQQGKIVPATLSFIGYLTVNPSGKYFTKSIQLLNSIAKSTDDIVDLKNKRTVQQDENYQGVEDILLSKIALDPAYKPIIPVDDPIARQIQAIFEKLEYSDTNKDFYIQYYLPYYRQVFTPKQFELFIYHIFSNANAKFIQDYLKKNRKEMDAFIGTASVYFDLIRATRELNFTKRGQATEQYLYDNGKLVGKGTLANNGKILTGLLTLYYPGGNSAGSGNYNSSGEREGDWVHYYFTGAVKAKEHMVNGKLDGKQEYFHDNGNPSSVESYVNGKADGLVTVYYYGGNLKSVTNYKADKKDGEEKTYYSNGNLHWVYNYLNGQLNGYVREYYKTGNVESVEQYTNGKDDGPFKSYYEDGAIEKEGQFVKDLPAGDWKFYDENGKVNENRSYVNGLQEGPDQEYFDSGQASSSFTWKKGKMDGDDTWYFKDGKVFAKYVYDKGAIKSVKYFNNEGKQLSASELVDGTIHVNFYSRLGFKTGGSTYDQKGRLQGMDTSFFPSGKIKEIKQYRNDTLNGPSVTYYLNGNKKHEVTKADGQDNGYYKSYYVNGQLETEGWEQDGGSVGEWLSYSEKGKLTLRSYYLDNDLDGFKEEYFPDGKKTLEEKYYRGWLMQMTQYNDAGNVIAVDSFPKSSGKYTLLYPGGQVMAQTMYVNGDYNGPYKTFYFDGSLESVSYFKMGLKDSTYRSYHYGGLKDDEGQYLRGEKAGVWKYYDDDGKLATATEYKNGEQNGTKTYYNPNGTVDYIGIYKDDLLEGDGKQFDIDGTLAFQVNYREGDAQNYSYIGKDGKLVAPIPIPYNNGALKAYYANGKPSRDCTYSDGQVNGKNVEYFGSGQVMASDVSAFGRYEGKYTEYYASGKIKSEYNYIDDDADGICKEFDENGVLKREMTYENGSYNGLVKIYDKNGKLAKTLTYYYGKLIAAKNE